jgi:hypothetical protein
MPSIVRTVVALLLVGIAIAILVLGGALDPSSDDHLAELDAALSLQDLNEISADSAPQQQVVNGWATVDLLEIQIRQQDDMLQAQGTSAALLMLVIALIGWSIVATNTPADDAIADQPLEGAVDTGTSGAGEPGL